MPLAEASTGSAWRIEPATAERWDDFEALMGPKGGSGGCWCLLWRLPRPAFQAGSAENGAGNRRAMQALFDGPVPPGLLAYDGAEAVGWCSLAPRAAFPRLASSRLLKPVDDVPVWSVTCFLVRRSHRRRGLAVALLRAAADFARTHGAAMLEGYPIEPAKADYPPVYAWTGFAAAFRDAGFAEVARPSPTRPIMRLRL
ncbi:Acetyltransferase (GNAT) family protein [Tistlia consotensis]|uniref:Acetyltransferase (GNAT) family protein n=1 Tax=Tistlia consotensis USBA 355 TaxID=560819 RepID=A0A1Y6BE73_9PROT|nr:GNAT family N-acetyltransferase [Tistlia consotensis]SMF02898.1 Acetyltransferase (GNAT) family protein [Tistlia consotensis USBA 355]SNR53198.1 Acetyltransferase (GNAT) family protein [Tistlia consotensis]